MRDRQLKPILAAYLVLLIPIAWLAAKFDPYQLDGDAVSFMDIADLIHHHHWAGVINDYWNPLYPACLAVAQSISHPSRWKELGAYYGLNYFLFFFSLLAVVLFTDSLVHLRNRMWPDVMRPLITRNALRFFGIALVVISATRELSLGKIRSDTLLEILLLLAFAMMMRALASGSITFAALMGLFLGLAYLTKSFGFVVAILSIAVMMLFAWIVQRQRLSRTLVSGATALIVFLAISFPYVTALSHQKHRLTIGDSGALNYAWFVSGTEKFHLQPSMTSQFGSAKVALHHPEEKLLTNPGVYSYRAEAYGTAPVWFDPTYFNDQVQPKFNISRLITRDKRNIVLVARYIFNHPEAPLLLLALLLIGVRFGTGSLRRESFWLPALSLGIAMWLIYGMVNIEERYVTLAYFVVVLPIFAMLRVRGTEEASLENRRAIAASLIVLLAFLSAGEMLRTTLEHRRLESLGGARNGWSNAPAFTIAHSLAALGVQPGSTVACMGSDACIFDPYWARLAGVRITEEVFNPDHNTLFTEWNALPNQQQVITTLKSQGDTVLIASFNPGELTTTLPESHGWLRLASTNFYALPLDLNAVAPQPAPTPSWGSVENPLP